MVCYTYAKIANVLLLSNAEECSELLSKTKKSQKIWNGALVRRGKIFSKAVADLHLKNPLILFI